MKTKYKMIDHQNVLECNNLDTKSVDNWFDVCERRGIPLIVVKHRRIYSIVEWDYITIPKKKDILLKNHALQNQDRLLCIFDQFSNRKSHYEFNALIGSFDNLLPDDARKAAQLVYEVFNDTLSK